MRKASVSLFLAYFALALLAREDLKNPSATTAAEFMRAIRADDLSALQKLAATSGSVNVRDSRSGTPLHYAAIYGSPQAVSILLDAGADPNARNQSDATPLVYAAWNLEKTQLLVQKGADVNRAQSLGIAPLTVAVSAHGNIEAVRYLVEKGADIGALDQLRESAFLRSAAMGDQEMLKFLMQKGADPRAANVGGQNALHNAVVSADAERVQLLLAAGSDPNAVNLFAGAVKKGHISLVHLSPLMLAAPYSDGDTIKALLTAGAHVNDVDVRKMSPLMLAIATDFANPQTVRQLIAAGADVNAKDQNGEAVLTWARKFRNPEILSQLEAAGAKGSPLPPAPEPAPGSQAPTAAEAMKRAVPLLTRSGGQFFQESGCSGCHHQPIQARAFAAMSHAGLKPEPILRNNFLASMTAFRPLAFSALPTLSAPPGDYDVLLAYLNALADLGRPADEFTDLMVHYVAVRQNPEGAWISLGIARPPIEDSTITRTALAIRALTVYGWLARHAEFEERIVRATKWLEKAKPITTYERADKISGLSAAGFTAARLNDQATALLQQQRPDGGWAQTTYLESDAYATGLVLHCLYTAGLISPDDERYQKGAAFLLRTQFPDGSWYVRSRAPKFQPYFQSGFPFNHDQWISATATSLAVMALAPESNHVMAARARR